MNLNKIAVRSNLLPITVIVESLRLMLHDLGATKVVGSFVPNHKFAIVTIGSEPSVVTVDELVGDFDASNTHTIDSVPDGIAVFKRIDEIQKLVKTEFKNATAYINYATQSVLFTEAGLLTVEELKALAALASEGADTREIRKRLNYAFEQGSYEDFKDEDVLKEVKSSLKSGWFILDFSDPIATDGVEILDENADGDLVWKKHFLRVPNEKVVAGIFRYKPVPAFLKELRELGLGYLESSHSIGALKEAWPAIQQSVKEGYTFLKYNQTIVKTAENLNFATRGWRASACVGNPVKTGLFRVLDININHALTRYTQWGWKLEELYRVVTAKVKEGYRVVAHGASYNNDDLMLNVLSHSEDYNAWFNAKNGVVNTAIVVRKV